MRSAGRVFETPALLGPWSEVIGLPSAWSQYSPRFVVDCCKETLLMTSSISISTGEIRRPCEDSHLNCRCCWTTRVWRSLPTARNCSCCSADSARTRRWEAGLNPGTRCCRTWRSSRSSSRRCKHPGSILHLQWMFYNFFSTWSLACFQCCFQITNNILDCIANWTNPHLR